MNKSLLAFAVLATSLALLTACPTPQKKAPPLGFNLTIKSSPTRGIKPVEVHLVALEMSNTKPLTEYSMSRYWELVRRGKPPFPAKVIKFEGEEGKAVTIDANDPVWAKFMNDQRSPLGNMHLYVLTDLTGKAFKDEKGTKDPRRLILPLDPERWVNRNINVEILPANVINLTKFRP